MSDGVRAVECRRQRLCRATPRESLLGGAASGGRSACAGRPNWPRVRLPPVGGIACLARQSADSLRVRRTATRIGWRLAIGTRRHGGNGGAAPARTIGRSAGLLGIEGAETLASPRLYRGRLAPRLPGPSSPADPGNRWRRRRASPSRGFSPLLDLSPPNAVGQAGSPQVATPEPGLSRWTTGRSPMPPPRVGRGPSPPKMGRPGNLRVIYHTAIRYIVLSYICLRDTLWSCYP